MYWLIGISMMLVGAMLAAFVVSVALSLAWPVLERVARLCAPASEARFWLAVGIAPALAGVLASTLLVAPGYLMFEPRHSDESIGWALAGLALLSAAVLLSSIARAALILRQSARVSSLLRRAGRKVRFATLAEAYELPETSRITTVIGVLRPTLFVSRAVLEALDPSELDSVVRHEQAHVVSRDNATALLLDVGCSLSANPMFARAVKSSWLEAVELAADDRAARTSEEALDLMSALVKFARLRDGAAVVSGLGCSFLPKATMLHLKRRVENLQEIADGAPRSTSGPSRMLVLIWRLAILTAIAALVAGAPLPMAWAHAALEILVKL